jgi:hypothetical protein
MTHPEKPAMDELPLPVTLAFAPVHKRAFGMATGVTAGLLVFAVTVMETLRNPVVPSPLRLLSEYFAGYTVSWAGAFIGLAWGLATGFVMGWFVAFCRNLVVAASIFWIRTRAELQANRDFLDHI